MNTSFQSTIYKLFPSLPRDIDLNEVFGVCILVICSLIFLTIYLIHRFRFNRALEIVKKSSPAYLGLQELNKRYEKQFHWFAQEYRYSYSVNSKQNFDHFFTSKKYNEELKKILTRYVNIEYLQDSIQWNEEQYKNYVQEYSSVVIYTTEETFQTLILPRRISYHRYSRSEHRLYLKALDVPMSFQITIHVSYRSPKGRNFYQKDMVLTDRQAINRYYQILDSEQAQTEAQKQRSLLTPKLRYEVMKRDGFRCVICGRSAAVDGVKLHVDHIKPVSKGGKTEMSNLRTLCQDCNLGKSAEYDENGIN